VYAATAAVTSIVPVGNDPQPLALSDDGSTLWVGLAGDHRVRRMTPGTTPVPGPAYALPTLLTTGERDEAVRLLRSYQPLPEDTAMSCSQVALLAMDAGAPDVAARYARRALELRPGWPEAQQVVTEATSRIPR